jgi:hypothetical protein
VEADSDRYPVGPECDHTNPLVYPGAPEIADGLDDDCDGQLGSWAAYSGPGVTAGIGVCQAGIQYEIADPSGYGYYVGPIVEQVIPSPELENGLDDDCDGVIDDLG